MDCPHTLPTSKSVVIRRGSLCVFPVSGRVPRPPTVQDPSLGQKCCPVGDKRTYVASPDRRMPTLRRLSGKVPPWCCRRIRASLWRDLQSGAPPWRYPHGGGAGTWCRRRPKEILLDLVEGEKMVFHPMCLYSKCSVFSGEPNNG